MERSQIGSEQELSDAALLAPLGLRAPMFLFRVQRGELLAWVEAGDTLAAAGRADRAEMVWRRALKQASTPDMQVRLTWRLAQLAQSQGQLLEAMTLYERAAQSFAREEAHADEAVAKMALARLALHVHGAGAAQVLAREAISAARLAADQALLGEALELVAEIGLELGELEEAKASFKSAIELFEQARDEAGFLRAHVALADVELERGDTLAALAALEVALPHLESHDSLEVRGRGMGLLALIQLESKAFEEAGEGLLKAREWLQEAGAKAREARLLVAAARRLEVGEDTQAAHPLYEEAFELLQRAGSIDRLRLAPVAYAVARCLLRLDDLLRADEAIEWALACVQEMGDVEGMLRCADLGARIAARMGQGPLALERLCLLGRAQARAGQFVLAMTTLSEALAAAMASQVADTGMVVEELMGLVREQGTEALGPQATRKVVTQLFEAHFPKHAAELCTMEAERLASRGFLSDAGRTFYEGGLSAQRERHSEHAIALWEGAVSIAEHAELPEAGHWRQDLISLLESSG